MGTGLDDESGGWTHSRRRRMGPETGMVVAQGDGRVCQVRIDLGG